MHNSNKDENAAIACLLFIFLAILATGIFTIHHILTSF